MSVLLYVPFLVQPEHQNFPPLQFCAFPPLSDLPNVSLFFPQVETEDFFSPNEVCLRSIPPPGMPNSRYAASFFPPQ